MKEFLQQYIDVIMTQREWSWALIAVVYFLLILLVRNLFLKPLIQRAKTLHRKYYHEIKTNYLNKCAFGWFLLLASTGVVSFLWFNQLDFPPTTNELGLLVLAFVGSLLAIHFHLAAFSIGCIIALKKLEDNQKIL